MFNPRDSLRQAEAALTCKIIESVKDKPGASEQRFFKSIQAELDGICSAIAEVVEADSCALFFVTEDAATEAERRIIMRAASGNFLRTLIPGRDSEMAREQGHHKEEVKGYTYSSRLHETRGKPADKQKLIIEGWPVTNQIWHLGHGRLANSNRAMNLLAKGHKIRVGKGDTTNYPNTGSLRSVFRNLVGIPIFARGGATSVLDDSEEEHEEFLSRYRVIGILKVENKKRQCSALPDQQKLIDDYPINPNDPENSQASKDRLDQWFKRNKSVENLKELFAKDPDQQDFKDCFELLNRPPPNPAGASDEESKSRPDSDLIDYLTRSFEAQFTQEDAELLVSLAMQLGRILARRTIEHAAQQDIVIGEHEVGALNVHYRDVRQLKAFFRACDCLRLEAEHFFQSLKTELEYERQREVYQVQVSRRMEPRQPIRQVTSRLKHHISLFRKLVNKQEELERQPAIKRLTLHNVGLELHNYGPLTERQAVASGITRLFWTGSPLRPAQARLLMKLGIKGGPEAAAIQHNGNYLDATLKDEIRNTNPNRSLVWRILNLYRVDDIAGVRVTCDYLSDLFHVLERLRARAPEWDIDIQKIEEAVEVAKDGGYRGIHITLKADVRRLLPPEDADHLQQALGLTLDDRLSVPCEIQLRTTLQESEALKSHDLTYKREEEVDKSLLELLHILSNQLHEADKTSDIIRDRVEERLLPNDFGERRLLNYLSPRLTREGLTLVELGLRCAKKIHERDLRLNGLSYMNHILATCERLVYNFEVTDPKMLLLAFLHDLWRNPCPEVMKRLMKDTEINKKLTKDAAELGLYDAKGLREDLNHQIRLDDPRRRDGIRSHFGARIAWDKLFDQFRPWFWVLLGSFRQFWRNYHKERHEDLGEWRRHRLKRLRHDLEEEARKLGAGANLNDWLQRAFVLEAAILLGQLEELPDEPNRQRREEEFREAYEELEIINSSLPPSPLKQQVIEETTKVFRETAGKLGVEVPINWYR